MSKATKAVLTSSSATNPLHPGRYVRDSILTPKKMSVSAAAKLVGVGRPAFSNFINGNVAATPKMASGIEVAFGIPAKELLNMQTAYEAKESGAPAKAMPYVVQFLGIKATDIESWVRRNISARTRLPVLLRTLVNSTGRHLKRSDFPGNNDAERPGWDGYIDSTKSTPWIPEGLSGWEFGTNEDIKGKADKDFAKAVKATPKSERDVTTFVFVTPRNWPGKEKWVTENNAKGQWKAVRAYDSSDLEQWLEQSIAGQAWFSNETQRPSKDVRTLDKCWADWADVAEPRLVGSLFAPAVDGALRVLQSRLSKPAEKPIIIAADSVEEALAFLAWMFAQARSAELDQYRDRVLVFDDVGVLPQIAQGTKDFIAVAHNREVEREFGPLAREMHTVVVYPRNAANAEPDIVLQPLNDNSFRSSLEEMGCGRDEITKYEHESGRSLTVLRRRLASVPAVRTPQWAADHETARKLIPFLFAGAWDSTCHADQTALTLLANQDTYENIETDCQHLARLNDAPLWSVGTYRGVVSKIDLLFAIANSVTSLDLKRYFDIAEIVLGEDDPKLDLEEDKRWAASIYGKSREFSSSLREGISETLVLLAVHGNGLLQARLGFDCESAVARLIRKLLMPLTTRRFEASDRDLPAYAEASPEEFLSILEEDLANDHPECYGLMRPVDSSGFGSSPARTGLLWALEGLAWNPERLHRVALVLAQLAGIEIRDNWVNKPINSLAAIFRVWMPQTAADHSTRLQVLKLIAKKFPIVAWHICLSQIDSGHRVGHYSHKPKWRNDAQGFGEPLKTWTPITAFQKNVVEMVLCWKGAYTREMLGNLIEHLFSLSEEQQKKVWELIKSWSCADASDADKAFVREKIRITVMSRRSAKRNKKAGFPKLSVAAKVAYESLEPTELLNKHEWLFHAHWVEESADEILEEDTDYTKRDERISNLRTNALREIYADRSVAGIVELAEMGNTAHQIGWLMVKEILSDDDVADFVLTVLQPSPSSQSWPRKSLVSGSLNALCASNQLETLMLKFKEEIPQGDLVQILLLAPFRRSVWQIVNLLDEEHRKFYWREVTANWILEDDSQSNEAVERFLIAERPRAAFACAHLKLRALRPELLFRLMSEMASDGKDHPGQYPLERYHVEEAFDLIDKNPALTLDQKATLEFAYLDVLSSLFSGRKSGRIPNLEKYVEANPDLFIRAIVWTYKRKDGNEDPADWQVIPGQAKHFAERGYKLLDSFGRIPGYDETGEIHADKLLAWIKVVRSASTELGRLDIAEFSIGKLLSYAPVGKDEVWPCESVRQVIEEVHSAKMIDGAHNGLYNSRGVVMRGEGGTQERGLAQKYRVWANALQYSHPFVSSQLLMGIVKTYEDEANREDTRAAVIQRIR